MRPPLFGRAPSAGGGRRCEDCLDAVLHKRFLSAILRLTWSLLAAVACLLRALLAFRYPAAVAAAAVATVAGAVVAGAAADRLHPAAGVTSCERFGFLPY